MLIQYTLTRIWCFSRLDSQANHSVVPYHYYEQNRISECRMYKYHEYKQRGGHRFITEKAIYAKWATRHKIQFKHPAWRLWGMAFYIMSSSTENVSTKVILLLKQVEVIKVFKHFVVLTKLFLWRRTFTWQRTKSVLLLILLFHNKSQLAAYNSLVPFLCLILSPSSLFCFFSSNLRTVHFKGKIQYALLQKVAHNFFQYSALQKCPYQLKYFRFCQITTTNSQTFSHYFIW